MVVGLLPWCCVKNNPCRERINDAATQGKRNFAPGFFVVTQVNPKENYSYKQKLNTRLVAQIRGTMISYNVIIKAEITNTAVASKMRMVTGQGLEKKSLAMECTPLLSEEGD